MKVLRFPNETACGLNYSMVIVMLRFAFTAYAIYGWHTCECD